MNTCRAALYTASDVASLIWTRALHVAMSLFVLVLPVQAVAFTLQFSDTDFIQTPIVGNVQSFRFTVDIDAPFAAGVYENPPLIQIDYEVSGEPVVGSPSGFDAFALSRSINGPDFYLAGNELVFEIADAAVLSDGVQAVELAGTAIIISFDAREEGTGRFHPARLELRADGTGQLQNSNNVPTLAEPEGIPAGSEYITDIAFDPGNLTLLTSYDEAQPDPDGIDSPTDENVQPDGDDANNPAEAVSSSSGSVTGLFVLLLLTFNLARRFRPGFGQTSP